MSDHVYKHIDRTLEMTSNAPTNVGQHVTSNTLHEHVAIDTQQLLIGPNDDVS